MRIVWIKVGGLWPPHIGGRLRSFHLISQLSRKHRVTVLTTHGPEDDPEGLAAALPVRRGPLRALRAFRSRAPLGLRSALLDRGFRRSR